MNSNTRFYISLFTAYSLAFIFSFNFLIPGIIKTLVLTTNPGKLYSITESEYGNTYGFVSGSAFFGCVFSQLFLLRFKTYFTIATIFYTVGGILQSVNQNYKMFLAGRIVVGFGIGIVTSTVTSYLARISSDEKRGTVCSAYQFFMVIGFFFSVLCSYLFNNHNWRLPFIAINLLSAAMFVPLFFIEDPVVESKSSKSNIFKLFLRKDAILSLVVGTVLHLSQHFACINSTMVIAPELFPAPPSRMWYHLTFMVLQVFFTLLNGVFIENFGRKQLLLLSTFVCLCSLSFIAFKKYVVPCLFIWISGFCLGLGPIVWIASSEIFPQEYCVIAPSFLAALNWLGGFVQLSLFFHLKGKIGSMDLCYLPFVVSLAAAFVFFVVFFKETKGRKCDFL